MTRPHPTVRSAVGAILVLGFAAGVGYRWMQGAGVDTLYQLMLVVLVAAGGIAVFGRRTFTTAADQAEEIADSGGDDGTDTEE